MLGLTLAADLNAVADTDCLAVAKEVAEVLTLAFVNRICEMRHAWEAYLVMYVYRIWVLLLSMKDNKCPTTRLIPHL